MNKTMFFMMTMLLGLMLVGNVRSMQEWQRTEREERIRNREDRIKAYELTRLENEAEARNLAQQQKRAEDQKRKDELEQRQRIETEKSLQTELWSHRIQDIIQHRIDAQIISRIAPYFK